MLVVMLDSNKEMSWFTENAFRAFENELKQMVIPEVDKNYRTLLDAKNRVMADLSMGGKEDIAYNNCKEMLAKFDQMKVKYLYSKCPGGRMAQ